MRLFLFPRILMQKAGDPNPGGGGGGDGGGDDTPIDPKLVGQINAIVHKALSEREKRFETKLTNLMNTAIGGKFDEIRQLLVDGDGDEEPKDPPTGQQPTPGQKHATLSPEQTAALKRAQQDAAEAKKKADEWENRAKQEAERNRKAEERQLLQSGLGGKVKQAFLDMTIDQLHAKNITRDEDTGAILWKDADGTLVPAKDGIAAWLKSDVGKEFIAPREARGSGGRGGEDVPSRPGSMTMEGLGDIVNNAMARNR